MSRAHPVTLPLCGLIAALAATAPGSAQPVSREVAGRPVHWTVDERLYHGDALLAPRFACNTHLSAAAPKDRTGDGCTLVKLGCDMGIKAACMRLAPYKPDFHNIERAARETSLFDMSTYTALHSPLPSSSPLSGGPRRVTTPTPSARMERKVYGGPPLQ